MTAGELRTSPRIRTGFILGTSFLFKPVQYSVVDDLALFEGDIVLDTVEQMERLTADIRESAGSEFGVGITGEQFRWPRGEIPFTIQNDLPDRDRVHQAIAHWHERTRIRLKERTDETDFVTFRPGSGCSSQVGRRGGQQFITLATNCTRGSTIHEIGHTVGLWHEQSREDRDLHIQIVFENIDPMATHNFFQHIVDGDDIGAYDFSSIMHYPATAFSINDKPTIIPLNGATIGQRNALSDGDVAAVHTLYPA